MNRYVLLYRSEAAGAARMLANLSTSIDELPAILGRYGGTLLNAVAVVGHYDAVAIVEFKDREGVLAYSLAAEAQGQVVEALPAFDGAALQRAEAVARRATVRFQRDIAARIDSSTRRDAPKSET